MFTLPSPQEIQKDQEDRDQKPKQERAFEFALLPLILIGIIDLIVNLVFFTSLAPDLWTKVGFGSLAVIAVSFKITARLWKLKGLWFLGASLTFYGSLSFFLTILSLGLPGGVVGGGVGDEVAAQALSSTAQGPTSEVAQRLQESLEYDHYLTDKQNYEALLLRQQTAGAEYRTYGQGLTEQIEAASARLKTSENALKVKERELKAEAETIESKKHESFQGLGVFSTLPKLLIRINFARDFVLSISIILGLLFGIGMGLFIESILVATVKKRLREAEASSKRIEAQAAEKLFERQEESTNTKLRQTQEKQTSASQPPLDTWLEERKEKKFTPKLSLENYRSFAEREDSTDSAYIYVRSPKEVALLSGVSLSLCRFWHEQNYTKAAFPELRAYKGGYRYKR